jgi:hypothetical protein
VNGDLGLLVSPKPSRGRGTKNYSRDIAAPPLKLSPRGWERLNVKGVFLALEVKDQSMIRAIVLTVAAVLGIALTKRRRPESFEKFEMSADNLKAAVKKVDNSAEAVEVALRRLMAA